MNLSQLNALRVASLFTLVVSACAPGASSHGAEEPQSLALQRTGSGAVEDCAQPGHCGELERGGSRAALPRYFTLSVSGADAVVEDQKLSGQALSSRIRAEAGDSRNAGAAVMLAEEFSGETLGALVWELTSAGFVHIVISQAALPAADLPTDQAASPGPEPDSEVSEPRPEKFEAASSPAAEEEAAVTVKNIGLHIGGGPNDDATKARFAVPIAKHFAEFRACHRLVTNPTRKASVGVDLLVSTKGGQAEVRDFRTALRGKKFRKCATRIFRSIRFPPADRPTMISYSLLFKPSS